MNDYICPQCQAGYPEPGLCETCQVHLLSQDEYDEEAIKNKGDEDEEDDDDEKDTKYDNLDDEEDEEDDDGKKVKHNELDDDEENQY